MALQKGDSVSVHYEGKLDDGTIFDSSHEREPLQFIIGEGKLLPKFEECVLGKSTGDTIEIMIPAQEAYGERDESLVVSLERSLFDIEDIQEGSVLGIETEVGPISVYVLECTDTTVTIDGNHPLAGQDLYFTITIQ